MTKIAFIKSVLTIMLYGLAQPTMATVLVIDGSDQVGCPLVTCGDPLAGGVQFQTDNTLFVLGGQNIGQTGGVSVTVTGGNNIGALFFQGTSTILGSVSLTGDILRLLTVNTNATVTADEGVRVTTVNLMGPNSNLIMTDETNLTTTQINGSNTSTVTLTLQGTNGVTGEIGSASGAVAVNLTGATGTVTTLGDITGPVTFINSNQELIVAPGKNINGTVMTTVNDTGTLTFQGSSVSGGDIGAFVGITPFFLHQVNFDSGVYQLNNNLFATNAIVASCATLSIQTTGLEIANLTNNGIVQLGSLANPISVSIDSGYKGNPGSLVDVYVINGGANFSNIKTAFGATSTIPDNGMQIIVSGNTVPSGKKLNVITTFGGTINVGTIPSTATYQFIPSVDVAGLEITFERTPISSFAYQYPVLLPIATFFDSIGSNIQTIAPGLIPVFDALNAQSNACTLQDALANLTLPVNRDLLAVYYGGTTRGFQVIAERMDNNRREFTRGTTRYKYGCFREYCDNIPCNYYMHSGQWIEFFGAAIDQKEEYPLEGLGYRGREWTLIAGYDKSFYPSFNAGVAVAYSQFQTDSRDNILNHHLKADSFQGYLYASHERCDGSYWDAIVSLVYNDYNQDRGIDLLSGISPGVEPCGINTIPFGFTEAAHGRFGGWQFNGYFEGGYQFRCQSFVVIPHAIARTAYLRLDEFSETGAPLSGYKNIKYDDMQALDLGGGVKVAKSIVCYKKYKVVPYAKLVALRDFKNTPQRVTAEFIGGGPEFLTTGAEISANSLTATLGITLNRRDNTFLTLEYDFERRTDFAVYGAFLKYRVEWC